MRSMKKIIAMSLAASMAAGLFISGNVSASETKDTDAQTVITANSDEQTGNEGDKVPGDLPGDDPDQ